MNELDHIPLEQLVGRLAELNAKLKEKGIGATSVDFIPHKPTPKQEEFLARKDFEVLYGGAAGGGKSDALLMAALQYVDVPSYSALLLRRTYADLALPGAILDRAHSWLNGSGAVWLDRDKRWTFPSGATITFGYLDSEKDKYRYASAEFQYIGFDELTQFPEGWYRFLLSRLRRLSTSSLPLRARSASNPGGIGHDWVRRRFVDVPATGCAFVPATLADNPHLDRESYELSLAQLDPTTKAQLLEGKWIRNDGGLVYRFDEGKNLTSQAPECEDRLLAIDYGYTDSTAFTIWGWRQHDTTAYCLESFKEAGITPGDAAMMVHELDKTHKFVRMVADIGGLGKGYAEEARQRFQLPIQPAEKRNKRGYIELMNGEFAAGRIKIVDGKNEAYVAELLELPWDQDRKAESQGFDNHLCFVAGTEVMTPSGPTPIEQIHHGDPVLTRNGIRLVVEAGTSGERETYAVAISNGSILRCTGDHPFWTEEAGFIPARNLIPCYTLRAWQPLKPLHSTAGSIGVTRSQLLRRTRDILARTEAYGCIETSGSSILAQFQKDIMSIIGMEIPRTTDQKISSAYLDRIISETIWQMLEEKKKAEIPCSDSLSLPQQNGMGVKKGSRFIDSSEHDPGITESEDSESVLSAWKASIQGQQKQRFALLDALRNSAEDQEKTTSSLFAQNATRNSCETGTPNQDAARCHVLHVKPTGAVERVFNLTVEIDHEYFAGGMLVSNCDSGLYGWRSVRAFGADVAPTPSSAIGTSQHWQEQERVFEEDMDAKYRVDIGREWWEK